ncbi:MAG: endonuclease domain-containing protein [Beijerinckiaceae bacterium]
MRGLQFIETHRARSLRRNSTSAERVLWQRLKNRGLSGFKFVRQAPIGPYIADFLCRDMNLVVEIDGATHSTDAEIASDQCRTSFLEEQGYRVMRFTNEAVYESAEGVLETILAGLQKRLWSA